MRGHLLQFHPVALHAQPLFARCRQVWASSCWCRTCLVIATREEEVEPNMNRSCVIPAAGVMRSYSYTWVRLAVSWGCACWKVMVSSVPSVDNLVLFLRKIRYLEWFHGFSLTGHLEPNSRILIQAFWNFQGCLLESWTSSFSHQSCSQQYSCQTHSSLMTSNTAPQ